MSVPAMFGADFPNRFEVLTALWLDEEEDGRIRAIVDNIIKP